MGKTNHTHAGPFEWLSLKYKSQDSLSLGSQFFISLKTISILIPSTALMSMKYHSHKAPPSIDLKNLPTFVSFSSAKSRVLSLLMTFPTSKLQVVVFFPKNTWFRALYRENRLSNNYLCEPPCICCQYVSGNR